MSQITLGFFYLVPQCEHALYGGLDSKSQYTSDCLLLTVIQETQHILVTSGTSVNVSSNIHHFHG